MEGAARPAGARLLVARVGLGTRAVGQEGYDTVEAPGARGDAIEVKVGKRA